MVVPAAGFLSMNEKWGIVSNLVSLQSLKRVEARHIFDRPRDVICVASMRHDGNSRPATVESARFADAGVGSTRRPG